MEKLLGEVRPLDGNAASSDELDAHGRLLERVASEVARLNFYAAKGKVRGVV